MARKKIGGEEVSQTNRLMIIYKNLLEGRRFSTKELVEFVKEEICETSERTVYRDISELMKIDDRIVRKKIGRDSLFYIPNKELTLYAKNIFDFNDALAIHVLKENLKSFKGTALDESITELIEKLEAYAPGEVFISDSIFWDKNIGAYDYKEFYSTIKCLIRTISQKRWIDVNYVKLSDDKEKYYHLFPFGIFAYNGALYLIGYYKKRNAYLTLAVHGIIEAKESETQEYEIPKFDQKEFDKNRFGVFSGNLKHVKLRIKKDFVKYFENREWHSSQKSYFDENNNYILEFTAPLSIDFIAWILSWQNALIVEEPQELKDKIVATLKQSLENYS